MTTTAAPPSATAPAPKPVNPIVRFFRARVLLWPMLLLVAVIVGASGFAITSLWLASPFSVATQSRSTQVVDALEKKGEVVVLQMSVVEMDDLKTIAQFYDFDIPGTNRATFLRYEFDAKLGFDGEDVDIADKGDGSFVVSIPEFVFIGFDNWDTEVSAEENGLLSWFTPAIDDREMAEDFITDDKKSEYVQKHLDDLKAQAQEFYTAIATSIDPDVTIEFEFAQ